MSPLEAYFDGKPEPLKGTMLALKDLILALDSRLALTWKYKTAFFCFQQKNVCYFSVAPTGRLYIGFVRGNELRHGALLQEGRKQIKVYYVNAEEDLDVQELQAILEEVLALY